MSAPLRTAVPGALRTAAVPTPTRRDTEPWLCPDCGLEAGRTIYTAHSDDPFDHRMKVTHIGAGGRVFLCSRVLANQRERNRRRLAEARTADQEWQRLRRQVVAALRAWQ